MCEIEPVWNSCSCWLLYYVKVAIFCLNEAEGERPSKVWRHKADLLELYKLAEVEKELIPDIEQKKLGWV